MFFKNIFRNWSKVRSSFNPSKDELNTVIANNRRSLSEISTWIDDVAMASSCFNYGVPDFIKLDLDKKLDNNPTYSDYMLLIAQRYFNQVSYLEIGVSVGKNFFQILNGLNNSDLVGFDIEDIYPVIEKKLLTKSSSNWSTPDNSIKKTDSSLKKYTYKTNTVSYLSADVWDENSWEKMNGKKFNIVFSDALHTPEAILFEFEMLVKYDLLADKFVIVWDDLVDEMQKSFYQIIEKYDRKYKIKDKYLISVNGWVGQFEGKHTVGIISNFELK
jgi:hypothetical protein